MQQWNLEGLKIQATYLDTFDVRGTVESSRVKYGGTVCHTVVLDKHIMIYNRTADRVIIEHQDVLRVCDNFGD